MVVISSDQGGTNITGYFLYFGGCAYDFKSWEDKNWTSHVEYTKNLLNEYKPKLFIFEECKQYAGNSKGFVNYHFRNVVKAGGAVEYVCHDLGISKYGIVNANEWRTQKKAKDGEIPGLVLKRIKGPKGYPRNTWHFKDRVINEHEKDALILFYMWNLKNGKTWPWIN